MRSMLLLMIPSAFGAAVYQINVLIVTLLASLAAYAIALGAQAHIYAALSALVPAITDEPVDGPDTIS